MQTVGREGKARFLETYNMWSRREDMLLEKRLFVGNGAAVPRKNSKMSLIGKGGRTSGAGNGSCVNGGGVRGFRVQRSGVRRGRERPRTMGTGNSREGRRDRGVVRQGSSEASSEGFFGDESVTGIDGVADDKGRRPGATRGLPFNRGKEGLETRVSI